MVSRSAPAIVDAEGRLRGWRGTAHRDITAQVDAQSSATRHDELLRKLVADPGMIFQFVRATPTRRAPSSSRGVVGVRRPAEQVMAHPDRAISDRASDDRARDLGHQALRRGRACGTTIYRVMRVDGHDAGSRRRASPERRADGAARCGYAFSADVTEREQTEHALRRVEGALGDAGAHQPRRSRAGSLDTGRLGIR